ncbi:MAG: J domain-containing protein [Chloroflexaceae bacterium]|nr:J domain-containing protein [Chloroflexaceae bacterium]
MATWKDYYAQLAIHPDADEQTIKQAYRKLVRQYHPDVAPDNRGMFKRFQSINEAYQVLSDPRRRQQYDVLWRHYQRVSAASTTTSAERPGWSGQEPVQARHGVTANWRRDSEVLVENQPD